MPDIRIDHRSFDPFAMQLHISEANAKDAVARPDQTGTIRTEGPELRVCVRKVVAARPPFSLLVVTRMDGEITTIVAALKVYPDLFEGAMDVAPLDLLRAVAERFGLTVTVAGLPGRIFLAQRVLIGLTPDSQILGMSLPDNKPFLGQFYLKIAERPERAADCALVFALDAERYLAWVQSH